MTEILDKTREWSDRFGSVLRASAQTQYPHLYKGAVGGIEHVISIDNGAFYMEMWRDGSETYYATTGAAIKPLPGLAKGARLDEALDRFFTLMSKVEKDYPPTASSKDRVTAVGGAWRDTPGGSRRAESGMSLPAKKAIPKKIKRLLGLKKRVMEKVDPEIGPSHSVGHRKPSDLSPESGVSKLAKRMIRNLVGEPTAQMRKSGPGPYEDPHPRVPRPYGPDRPKPSKKPPVKKNVVALTAPGGVGNQPGSGRVKPGTGVKVTDPMQPAKPGTPPKTYRSPQGFSGRRMGAPGAPGAPAGTSGSGIKRGEKLGQKTSQRRAPYVGSRPAGVSSPLLRRRKIDDITGGRVGAGGKIMPVKPGKGGAGQPVGYGSTGSPQYSYGRKSAKGCDCRAAEIAKALREIQ